MAELIKKYPWLLNFTRPVEIYHDGKWITFDPVKHV
jgi:hypothetical protein